MKEFDPDMTYWQSLRIVTIEMVTKSPMNMDDVDEICEGMQMMMSAAFCVLVRIAIRLTLPVSVFLLAWGVQVDRRRTAARKKEVMRKHREQYGKLHRTQHEPATTSAENPAATNSGLVRD